MHIFWSFSTPTCANNKDSHCFSTLDKSPLCKDPLCKDREGGIVKRDFAKKHVDEFGDEVEGQITH